jgi:phosphoribosyl 1,2-cyclic phosphodiesterase
MKIKFWGVRGSIPTPPTSDQIKQKISKFMHYCLEKKIKDVAEVNRLLETFPAADVGLIGGNTSCIELRADDKIIIFDMGSGIKNLGNYIVKHDQNANGLELHIFISHTHWDHIHGFPFFVPAFFPRTKLYFYSGHPNLKGRLELQQDPRFFPVALDHMAAKKEFIQLKHNSSIQIGNITIQNCPLYHPGGSFSYRVEHQGKIFIYATDSEYKDLSGKNTEKYTNFFKDADLLVFDAQYTFEESIHKEDWGHSSALIGIDFAIQANIKRLALFHHEPERDDYEIEEIVDKSIEYRKINYPATDLEIFPAIEGMEIQL